MSDEQMRAELLREEMSVLYGKDHPDTPKRVITVDANGKVVEYAHMPFTPTGASPLSEKGYDVNEPKET